MKRTASVLRSLCLSPLVALTALSACSTSPAQRISGETLPLSSSSVEIVYVLGHNQRKLLLSGQPQGAKAKAFLDQTLLNEAMVDLQRYGDFLRKALLFVSRNDRAPAMQAPCRAPFTVTVRIAAETHGSSGCRFSDEGMALSRLVKDGEFLLYSKK
jgi:hypothetical protein